MDYLLWEYLLAEPKVSEHHMALTVQQNVLQLDVTVHYAQLRAMVTMLGLQMLSTCMSAQCIQHDMEGHPCITLCAMRGTPHLVEVLQGKSNFSNLDSGLLL